MKTVLGVGVGIMIAVALVVAGLSVGWALWGRSLWMAGPFTMPGMMGGGNASANHVWGDGSFRTMGRDPGVEMPCGGWGYQTIPDVTGAPSGELSIEQALEAAKEYIAGYPDLEIVEVMEFERNFYAIARETGSHIGAMELLVDKWTGSVGPEMGPNMMWNARYGMHSERMMDDINEVSTLTPDEALASAQRWLDANLPGATVEAHADPFYGYYTIHTLQEGEIEGMLSVHGTSGQVWYHTWHGAFIQMIEEKDHH